jgi:hypothetical protein
LICNEEKTEGFTMKERWLRGGFPFSKPFTRRVPELHEIVIVCRPLIFRPREAIDARSNRWLAAAVAGTVLLQLVVVYAPVFNRLFDTVLLSSGDLTLATLLASAVFATVQIEKLLQRRADRTRPVSLTQDTYLTRLLSS